MQDIIAVIVFAVIIVGFLALSQKGKKTKSHHHEHDGLTDIGGDDD